MCSRAMFSFNFKSSWHVPCIQILVKTWRSLDKRELLQVSYLLNSATFCFGHWPSKAFLGVRVSAGYLDATASPAPGRSLERACCPLPRVWIPVSIYFWFSLRNIFGKVWYLRRPSCVLLGERRFSCQSFSWKMESQKELVLGVTFHVWWLKC